jgi:hypothetical protein
MDPVLRNRMKPREGPNLRWGIGDDLRWSWHLIGSLAFMPQAVKRHLWANWPQLQLQLQQALQAFFSGLGELSQIKDNKQLAIASSPSKQEHIPPLFHHRRQLKPSFHLWHGEVPISPIMSLTRVSIRPPSGYFAQFQRHRLALRSPLVLAIRWAVHEPSKGVLAVITARCQSLALVRFQSTTNRPGSRSQKDPDGDEPPPRQTLTRVLLRALWASFQSLGAPFRPGTIRKLYRQNPVELVLALGV